MMRLQCFAIVFTILTLACSTLTPTPQRANPPLATATPTPTATAQPKFTVIFANVNIRDADLRVTGLAHYGDVFAGSCAGDWCISDGAYIWRGCTDRRTTKQWCR